MKKLLFLLIIGILAGCKTVSFAPTNEIADFGKIDRKKIALVGFYHFKTTRTGNMIHAEIDYENSMKEQIRIGVPVEQIPVTGNAAIKEEDAGPFFNNYMKNVKRSGLPEMNKVLITKEKDKLSMQKRNVDYYVVGAFDGPFGLAAPTGKGDLYFILTVFPSLATLFTLPILGEEKVKAFIYVYDKDLKLVKEFTIEDKFSTRVAWWNFNKKNLPEKMDEKARRRFLSENLIKKTEAELFHFIGKK